MLDEMTAKTAGCPICPIGHQLKLGNNAPYALGGWCGVPAEKKHGTSKSKSQKKSKILVFENALNTAYLGRIPGRVLTTPPF